MEHTTKFCTVLVFVVAFFRREITEFSGGENDHYHLKITDQNGKQLQLPAEERKVCASLWHVLARA